MDNNNELIIDTKITSLITFTVSSAVSLQFPYMTLPNGKEKVVKDWQMAGEGGQCSKG